MSSMHPQDSRPGGADQQRLQSLIDTLAHSSRGHPIGAVRERLVEELARSGFTPPSESWVDAVAREAVHGRVYGVSMASLAGHELATPEQKALEDAPAHLTLAREAAPTDAAGPLVLPGATSTAPGAASQHGHRRLSLAIVIVIGVLLMWRRRSTRRERSTTGNDGRPGLGHGHNR